MEKHTKPINTFLQSEFEQNESAFSSSNVSNDKKLSKKSLFIIIGVLSIISLAFVSWYIFIKPTKNIDSPITTANSNTKKIDKDATPNPEIANLTTEESLTDNANNIGTSIIKNGVSEKLSLKNNREAKAPSDTSSNFNILILGIDRRSGDQTSWRTDVIQLITLNPERTRAVLTHIPRDVWADKYKINAIYNLYGADAIKDQVENVTGQRPDRIIRIDFDAFVWAVDSVGGLTINVPNSFTDESYPNDRNGKEELISVTFEKGEQKMDGEEALIYARSRKGTNGEGSDYARGLRQQYIMEAIIDDYFKPDNLFKEKTPETLYKIATQKVYTDITLADMPILYNLLKSYASFKMEELSLNTANYLEVPANRSNYGGAWTLVAKNNDYKPIHDKISFLVNPK